METKENSTTTPNAATQPNLSGFDFGSLLSNQSLIELLKHLLSGAGAMTGSYFMWIRPMQDKMDTMSAKISDQEKRLKELEAEIETLKALRPSPPNQTDIKGIDRDYYFEVNHQNAHTKTNRRHAGLRI